jgi:hypothetical protein
MNKENEIGCLICIIIALLAIGATLSGLWLMFGN